MDNTTEKTKKANTDTGQHATEALVLNCMDHRLVDHVVRYMNGRGMRNKYDQITLAGASIGVLTKERTSWGETFWEHVELAKKLHGIKKIIVIDHRDCGACKAFISPDCADDPANEHAVHKRALTTLASEIHAREPDLQVELLLMELDGSVEQIGPA